MDFFAFLFYVFNSENRYRPIKVRVIHDGVGFDQSVPNAMPDKSRARRRRGRRRSTIHGLEVLETRDLLATLTVTNLQNAGTGSFRQAIIEANKRPGADTIEFGVAGTIRISGASLPTITGSVTINGATAPGFNGSPVVTIDFQGSKGLNFAKGADGSTVSSLALVRAGNAGVTLNASDVTVEGNDIGLLSNGSTVAGNRGDGVRINRSSHGDLIGQTDPVTSVDYYPTQDVYTSNGTSMQVSGWQGIRAAGTSGNYLIAGTSESNGLLYRQPAAMIRRPTRSFARLWET